MKSIRKLFLALPAILLIVSLSIPQSATAAKLIGPSTTPNAGQPPQGDIPPLTEDEPVNMPDLLGQSLDYATMIWDNDETLPTIRVEGAPNGPGMVVIRQSPAPGTLIHPSQATIVLTLGKGPVVHPKAGPTPSPSFTQLNAAA